MKWNLSCVSNYEEAIRVLKYRDLVFQNEFYWEAFRQFIQLVSFAWHIDAKNILELGAGVSTVLFAEYAQRNDASVLTVDTSYARVRQVCSRDSKRLSDVEKHVRYLEGTTISASGLEQFYSKKHETLCDLEPERILSGANMFINHGIRYQRYAPINEFMERGGWDARRIFSKDNKLWFPKLLLDHFSEQETYSNFLDVHRNHDNIGQGDVIANHKLSEISWDIILFDCGELSSLIEFILLSKSIRPGGLAAFHDIFFPKSFKNFIVCGIISQSPDWEIVYLNNTTIQGFMVARKNGGSE